MAGPIRTCSVPECASRAHGRGLCVKHYRRLTRNGSTDVVLRRFRGADACAVEGCSHAGPLRQDLCSLHYQRMQRSGSPTATPGRTYLRGNESHAWTDRPAYRTVHGRLDRDRGPAKAHTCTCGAPAAQWAYDHRDPDELTAVVSGGVAVPYSVKPEHYSPLCHPCHRALDAKGEI